MSTIIPDRITERAPVMPEQAAPVAPAVVEPPSVPIADLGPLGLAGLALTTFVLCVFNAGLVDGTLQAVVLPIALFYGGIAQLPPGCGSSGRTTRSARLRSRRTARSGCRSRRQDRRLGGDPHRDARVVRQRRLGREQQGAHPPSGVPDEEIALARRGHGAGDAVPRPRRRVRCARCPRTANHRAEHPTRPRRCREGTGGRRDG